MRDQRTQSRARALRAAPTDAERRLWHHLRGQQLDGFKFRRQYPIGPFIADFACLERRLIVEADGGQHGGSDDADRDRFLETRGYRVLRFWNDDVLLRTQAVLESIRAAHIADAPIPAFPRKRGKENGK
jgi:very-short-patch-repair endonuclease